jgi:hypothetical protein
MGAAEGASEQVHFPSAAAMAASRLWHGTEANMVMVTPGGLRVRAGGFRTTVPLDLVSEALFRGRGRLSVATQGC